MINDLLVQKRHYLQPLRWDLHGRERIGDFRGLLERLDYIQGLGIKAIWLMPFQPSPGRDGGHDVADYCGVDPHYGTWGDFVEFAHGCKQRGLRVLIDLVVNHTSDQHP